MTTLERLEQWRRTGILSDAQHTSLSALVRKERFSLFLELNALLYLGVLSLVAGLGWTIQTHFAALGDIFVIGLLTSLLSGSLYYCFSHARAFSTEEVESPNFIFDYVVYLACLVLSLELAFLEFRFEWLKDAWDNYLLVSSAVFFVLAYRFDNRFVLSLALSSLAGWFGIKVSRYDIIFSGPSQEFLRIAGLTYGAIVSLAGTFLYRQRIKKHFLETYLHVASTVIFIALFSGLFDGAAPGYLLALLLASGTAIALGVRFKRFAFVVYGTVFGYAGVSIELLRHAGDTAILTYLVVTGTGVILLIALLARRFGREE
jgi:hypothetical protein